MSRFHVAPTWTGVDRAFTQQPKLSEGDAMRPVVVGSALAAIALLAVPGSVSASPLQVEADHFNGTVAVANWGGGTSTFGIGTTVTVEQSSKGTLLNVFQSTVDLDSDGNATGFSETLATVTSGFSYRIDSSRLASATLAASGLPATTCAYDASFNQVGECTNITVGVNVTWTGRGPITHTVYHSPATVTPGVVVFTGHDNSSFRDASSAGTTSGLLPPGDSQGGYLLRTTQGRIIVCVGADWDTCLQ